MKTNLDLPVKAVPGKDHDAILVDRYGAMVASFIPNGDEDMSAFDNARFCAAVINAQEKSS